MSAEMHDRILAILSSRPVTEDTGEEIGRSREGRPIHAWRLGSGSRRVSLLAGCHADEPVGPRLLRHFASYLTGLQEDDPLRADYEWWIVPHINPDGAERNRSWQIETAVFYDLPEYLTDVVRELPGDDIEFCFPRDSDDDGARPENRAVYDWWRSAKGEFDLHVSLHGMGFAAGPWFLIEPEWKDRCALLKETCAARVHELGYTLHDVERQGEKGFFRIERGFSTRPDSRFMREYFIEQGNQETADLFRPSSMETVRSMGGDTLTLVSEMPLFITSGVGERIGPPDAVADLWKTRIEEWRAQLAEDGDPKTVAAEAAAQGLRAMPVHDQMALQWTFIVAGIEQLEDAGVWNND
jgi:hypothetical protein